MTVITESFGTSKQLNYGTSAPAIVLPEKDKLTKHFPFIIAADVSKSTLSGAQPDCYLIQDAVNAVLAELSSPAPGSPLADNIHKAVISVVAFNDKVIDPPLVSWSKHQDLPMGITLPAPSGATGLVGLLEHALAYHGDLLRTFRHPNNRVRSAPLSIFVITDGCITDCAVGSPKWTEIHTRLTSLTGGENQRASVAFYISPNGCALGDSVFRVRDASGQEITGQAAMALLGGPKSVYEMKEIASFPALVSAITSAISNITGVYGASLHSAADQAARQTNGLITNYD